MECTSNHELVANIKYAHRPDGCKSVTLHVTFAAFAPLPKVDSSTENAGVKSKPLAVTHAATKKILKNGREAQVGPMFCFYN